MANFVWASKKPLDDIATICESNITLNKAATGYFANAYVVLLGLDRDNKSIAIKPITKEEINLGYVSPEQQHNITIKSSYSRICNKLFLKEIAKLMELDFSNNNCFKYRAVWDGKEKALIIDLKKSEG